MRSNGVSLRTLRLVASLPDGTPRAEERRFVAVRPIRNFSWTSGIRTEAALLDEYGLRYPAVSTRTGVTVEVCGEVTAIGSDGRTVSTHGRGPSSGRPLAGYGEFRRDSQPLALRGWRRTDAFDVQTAVVRRVGYCRRSGRVHLVTAVDRRSCASVAQIRRGGLTGSRAYHLRERTNLIRP